MKLHRWEIYELCDEYQTNINEVVDSIADEVEGRGTKAKEEAYEFIIHCLVACIRDLLKRQKKTVRDNGGCNFSWRR